MVRPAPPPDFRYVGLSPALLTLDATFVGAGVSTAVAGGLAVALGAHASTLVATVVASGLSLIAFGKSGARRVIARIGAEPAAMAIVPWGVVIDPGAAVERVLRWSGVRSIDVDYVHTRDPAGNSATAHSFVTVCTDRERLVGRASGQVSLERLVAHLDAYARESTRAVALDLDGTREGPGTGFDPVARELLGCARDIVASGEGAERLSLAPASYRGVALAAATDDTQTSLRGLLRGDVDDGPDGPDRRALAALIAAEIGAVALVPDLLRLVTAAHPLVAAACKAAALRLGAEPTRTGSLDEVAPFVTEDDLEVLAAWADCSSMGSNVSALEAGPPGAPPAA